MIASVSGFRFTALTQRPTPAPAPREAARAGDRLQLTRRPSWITVVPGRDSLRLRIEPGTTLWSLATLYATDYRRDNTFGQVDARDTAPFVRDLQQANGLKDANLRVGQTLEVPTAKAGTNLNLDLAVAIQKSVDARRKAGQHVPELDFTGLRVGPGPVDSYVVEVKKRGTCDFQRFYVADDLSGEHPNSFLVHLPSETPFEAPEPSTFFHAGKDHLGLRVSGGMTLWSIARQFAPDQGGDLKVDSADIKAYVETLKQPNGLKSDLIQEGQNLVVPTRARGTSRNLEVAVVIQNSFALRLKAGQAVPDADYTHLTVTKAPDGTMLVALPLYEDPGVIGVVVKPDASGRYPGGYDVTLAHEA